MRSAFFCGGIVKKANAVFFFVFVLLTLQPGSIISASSGGHIVNSSSGKTNILGGKKLWDYSIHYSVQLVGKIMLLAEQLRS
jgi:hypothetical protein